MSLWNTFAANSLQYFISVFGNLLCHGCCIRFDFWNNMLFSELNGLFCMYVDYVVVHHSCPPGALRGGFLGAVSLLSKARDSQGSDQQKTYSLCHVSTSTSVRCVPTRSKPIVFMVLFLFHFISIFQTSVINSQWDSLSFNPAIFKSFHQGLR